MFLPNLLTLARLFLTPVIIWLIVSNRLSYAFAACLFAGATDAFDGYLARRFNWQTALGSYLDPVADKFLLVSLYVTLGVFGHLPAWLAIAVVSRDILIIGAVILSWLMGMPLEIRPVPLSKLNTAAQILLALIVLASASFGDGLRPLTDVLIWIVTGLTVTTAGIYVIMWLRHMAGPPQDHG